MVKLIKTDSGTDWEAYQVIKTDTARWVEDDVVNVRDILDYNDGFEIGFKYGIIEERKRIIKIIGNYKQKGKEGRNQICDYLIKQIRGEKTE